MILVDENGVVALARRHWPGSDRAPVAGALVDDLSQISPRVDRQAALRILRGAR